MSATITLLLYRKLLLIVSKCESLSKKWLVAGCTQHENKNKKEVFRQLRHQVLILLISMIILRFLQFQYGSSITMKVTLLLLKMSNYLKHKPRQKVSGCC